MNWFLLIPAVGIIATMIADPMAIMYIPLFLVFFTGVAFLMEKIFGPRKRNRDE